MVVPDRPANTIQAKIEQYRQQASKHPELADELQPNFFEVYLMPSHSINSKGFMYTQLFAFNTGHDTKDYCANKASS